MRKKRSLFATVQWQLTDMEEIMGTNVEGTMELENIYHLAIIVLGLLPFEMIY